MTDTEYHQVKVSALVKAVHLSVRFPCSLSFQLKADNNVSEGNEIYELKSGECEPNALVPILTQVTFRKQKYVDKNITLIAMMNSASGKIPAGSIKIPLVHDGQLFSNSCTSLIEKCPDKKASIDYEVSVEFVKQTTKNIAESLAYSQARKPEKLSIASSQPYSVRITKQKSTRKRYEKINPLHLNFRTEGSLSPRQRSRNHSSNKSSQHDHQQSGNPNYYHHPYNSELRERSRVQYRRSEKWEGYDDQLQKYKNELDMMSMELNKYRDRNRQFERKEKQMNLQIRELKQKVEKSRNKTLNTENSQFQLSMQLQQKQKMISKLQGLSKSQKEEIEDIKLSVSMQEKRLELKENSFKQQISKLSEKYQHSQNQRQNATFQLNNMLTELQKIEKKNQQLMKQKDLGYLEEKNKMMKKIQLLNQEFRKIKEQNQDLLSKLSEMKNLTNLNSISKDQLQREFLENKEKIINLESEIRKLNSLCNQKDRKIMQLESLQNQLSDMKRKNLQLFSENAKNKQKLQKNENHFSMFQIKVEELEKQVQSSHSSKQNLQNKNIEQVKQINSLQREIVKKNEEIGVLEENLVGLKDRLTEIKIKFDHEKMSSLSSYEQISMEIVYLTKTKESLESDNEEYKWKLQKSEQLCEIYCKKLNDSSLTIEKLNREILNQQQKLHKSHDNTKEQENKIDAISAEILSKQLKQRELLNELKNRKQSEYTLKKQLKQKEQEKFLLQQKLRQSSHEMKEEIQQLQKNRDAITSENNRMRKELELLKSDLNSNLDEKSYSKKLLDRAEVQMKENTQTMKGLEMIISQKDTIMKQFEEKYSQESQRSQKKQQKCHQLSGLLSLKQQQINELRSEFKGYKQKANLSLESLLESIDKSTNDSNAKILEFPNEAVAQKILAFLNKHRSSLQKHRQELKLLKDNYDFTVSEFQKYKVDQKERESELQSQLKQAYQKYNSSVSQNLKEKKELMEKLMEMEEKYFEATAIHEKLNSQCLKLKQQNCDHEKERKLLIDQREQIYFMVQSLKKEKEQLLQNQSLANATTNSEFDWKLKEKASIIQKLQSIQKENESRINNLMKQIEKKQKQNQEIKDDLNESCRLRQKVLKKLQFEQNKNQELQQLKKGLQCQLKNQGMKLKKSTTQIQTLNKKINQLQVRIEQSLIKAKKVMGEKAELQEQRRKAQTQLDQMKQNLHVGDKNVKKIQEEHKSVVENLNSRMKELQETIISLSSEIELKTFLHQQSQLSTKQFKNYVNDYERQVKQKKDEIGNLQVGLEKKQKQLIKMEQVVEDLQRENGELALESKEQKDMIERLMNEITENSRNDDIVKEKLREIDNLKAKLEIVQYNAQINNKDFKEVISNQRQEIQDYILREKQLQLTIQELEAELQAKIFEYQNEQHYNHEESEGERANFIEKIRMLEDEIDHLHQEYEYLREQSSHQVQQLNTECMELTNQISEKDELISTQDDQIRNFDRKIKLLSNELKTCLQAWEREKRELKIIKNKQPMAGESLLKINSEKETSHENYNNLMKEVENRSKNILSRSRRNAE